MTRSKAIIILSFWGYQILIAFDQFINTLFLGWADETFSARCYRVGSMPDGPKKLHFKILRRLIDGLFFWETHHCETLFRTELARDQVPRIYRLDGIPLNSKKTDP